MPSRHHGPLSGRCAGPACCESNGRSNRRSYRCVFIFKSSRFFPRRRAMVSQPDRVWEHLFGIPLCQQPRSVNCVCFVWCFLFSDAQNKRRCSACSAASWRLQTRGHRGVAATRCESQSVSIWSRRRSDLQCEHGHFESESRRSRDHVRIQHHSARCCGSLLLCNSRKLARIAD